MTRDNFIPLFDNNIKNYKEWRARILLYGKKMSLQNKGKEATINLLTSLTGVSWRQVEHDAEKLAESEDGFPRVLAMLDKCFKYDSRVEAPRSMELFFFTMGRRPEQTLLTYVSEHKERQREIGKTRYQSTGCHQWLAFAEEGWTDNGTTSAGDVSVRQ